MPALPSLKPTFKPTKKPTSHPTFVPTLRPSSIPSAKPTRLPTFLPSRSPTCIPSRSPTLSPTPFPSISPVHSQNPSSLTHPELGAIIFVAVLVAICYGYGIYYLRYQLCHYIYEDQDTASDEEESQVSPLHISESMTTTPRKGSVKRSEGELSPTYGAASGRSSSKKFEKTNSLKEKESLSSSATSSQLVNSSSKPQKIGFGTTFFSTT
jgi:hypothetical protein